MLSSRTKAGAAKQGARAGEAVLNPQAVLESLPHMSSPVLLWGSREGIMAPCLPWDSWEPPG